MQIEFAKLTDIEYLTNLLTPMGLKLVGALAIFLIGWWAAKLIVRFAKGSLLRAQREETLVDFLGTVIYITLMAFVIIAALGQLGVKTTAAVAILGGSALAIGLSLQKQLASLAAGVMIILFRPFRKGDFVEAGNVSGVVEEVNIVNTVLVTPNNQQVTVPNAQVWDSPITNYSIHPTRRIDLALGVSYGSDLKLTRRVIERVIAEEPRILDDPAPMIAVKELADSAVVFAVRPWTRTTEYWAVLFDLTETLKVELEAAGVGIPFPQMDVHLDKLDAQNPPEPKAA